MNNISIIITFFNRPEYLKKTLKALIPQLIEGDEVIVVNDGGRHPTLPEGVIYLWQERQGYRLATARNVGIAQAGNPYVVSLDDGIVPDPEFLEAYRKRVKPRLLLLGGLRFKYDPKETRYWPPEMSRTYEYPDHMRGFGGQQCFCREDAVAVGGFDERFNGCWGYEDSAFLKAMMCSGVKVEKCFEAMATHLYHPPSFTEECKDRNRALMRVFVEEYEKGVYPKWRLEQLFKGVHVIKESV